MEFLTHGGFDFKKGFYGFMIVIFIIIAIAGAFHRRQQAFYRYYY